MKKTFLVLLAACMLGTGLVAAPAECGLNGCGGFNKICCHGVCAYECDDELEKADPPTCDTQYEACVEQAIQGGWGTQYMIQHFCLPAYRQCVGGN